MMQNDLHIYRPFAEKHCFVLRVRQFKSTTFQVDSTTRSFLNNLLRTHIILYYVIQSFQSLQVYLALGKQSSLRSLAKLLGVVIFSKETYGF